MPVIKSPIPFCVRTLLEACREVTEEWSEERWMAFYREASVGTSADTLAAMKKYGIEVI